MKDLDHILALVERPSRYIGGEVNSVKKTGSGAGLRIVLAFPDTYDIGMSHFGIQILYHILNLRAEFAAERVFAPGTDMAGHLKEKGLPLFSLETRRPIASFDLVGFSLLYELNYTNVLMMLDLAGIPLYSSRRDESFPLVIAGGPCTVNPEPVALFFDALVVGEGEPVIGKMAEASLAWKQDGSRQKADLLRQWAEIPGVYVPSFFDVRFDSEGRQETRPLVAGYEKVVRAVTEDLDQAPFPAFPVVPYGRPVHDRLRLEIARGCTRGCRFCQAGMIYRPVRERSLELLESLARQGIDSTGYGELSLLSLSTGDYSCLMPLMARLLKSYQASRLALSIPSFRAGTLSPEMMEIIRAVRKTGFTIAPEAGNERMRAVINKNISEAEIYETMKSAFELGWQLIKLYFMIGLPTETAEDAKDIASLVRRLKAGLPRGKRGARINVSLAAFIPKAHCPFQWAGQLDPAAARERIEAVRHGLGIRGVEVKWHDPELSRLEGIFARGDRRLSAVLESAWRRGCVFDGWSDFFDRNTWDDAFSDGGVNPDFYLGQVDPASRLAWDHIDTGVKKQFLKNEYEKALGLEQSPDCRNGQCLGCGVCDFESVKPVLACASGADTAVQPGELSDPAQKIKEKPDDAKPAGRYRINYSKTGPARYFGHLELANIIVRALRRAKIELVYSRGYHPKPKIAFSDALPVGIESMCECFYMTAAGQSRCPDIIENLNRNLPDGLAVVSCRQVPDKAGPGSVEAVVYRVEISGEQGFDKSLITRFFNAGSFPLTLRTGKGAEREIDLKSAVEDLKLVSPQCIEITLRMSEGPVLRPGPAVSHIFKFPGSQLPKARITKISQESSDQRKKAMV